MKGIFLCFTHFATKFNNFILNIIESLCNGAVMSYADYHPFDVGKDLRQSHVITDWTESHGLLQQD